MIKPLLAVVLLACATAHAQIPNPQLPQTYIDTTYHAPRGSTLRAHTVAAFQNALTSANPGDTIVLDAGVTYAGNFYLPVKTNRSRKWIYIVSSNLANLPAPGTRVDPSTDAVNMPKIVSLGATTTLTINAGASYYRLVGLEITTASTQGCNLSNVPPINCFTYNLVNAATTPTSLVDSITIDRCYIHGSPTQDVQHAVIGNASNFAVVDSYISDVHMQTIDSQAFLAYYSPGPIKLVNNLFSATSEDVMFGGAGGQTNPYIPSDIEIRNNTFYKPLSWATSGTGGTLPPNNQWAVKDNLEFKSARRVLADSNIIQNNWMSAQVGFSVLFTVRTSQSGDIAVVDDVTFTNNILQDVGAGFNTLWQDDQCGNSTYPNCTNPGETRRVKIADNLVLFRDPSLPGGVRNTGIQMSPGLTDFLIQHNSFIPAPNTSCWNAIFFPVAGPWPPPQSVTHNIWFLDNVLCQQPTGDWGGQGTAGLTYYMGDPTPLASRYLGNVMFVPSGFTVQTFPPENDPTTTALTYVNPNGGNYQLVTPNWTQTSDGQISGISNSSLPVNH